MYSFTDKVRYSLIDAQGKLSIPGAIDYMEDCSTMQSEQLGIGLEFLKNRHEAWVLNSWQIDFLEDIPLAKEIEICTWAYGIKGIYGYRNFLIRDMQKKPLIKTNSLWVYIDTETKRPMRVPEEAGAPYGKEPRLEMEYLDRKIKLEGEGTAREPFSVRRCHIDTNGHVNNNWYIRFAMEYLPEAFWRKENSARVSRLRAEYKREAFYGDMIYPVVYENDGMTGVSLNASSGEAYAIVAFYTSTS